MQSVSSFYRVSCAEELNKRLEQELKMHETLSLEIRWVA